MEVLHSGGKALAFVPPHEMKALILSLIDYLAKSRRDGQPLGVAKDHLVHFEFHPRYGARVFQSSLGFTSRALGRLLKAIGMVHEPGDTLWELLFSSIIGQAAVWNRAAPRYWTGDLVPVDQRVVLDPAYLFGKYTTFVHHWKLSRQLGNPWSDEDSFAFVKAFIECAPIVPLAQASVFKNPSVLLWQQNSLRYRHKKLRPVWESSRSGSIAAHYRKRDERRK